MPLNPFITPDLKLITAFLSVHIFVAQRERQKSIVTDIAARWRKEFVKPPMRDGFVVIYDGEVQGWKKELDNPDSWKPGVIAVDSHGSQWETSGGNDVDGALRWVSFS